MIYKMHCATIKKYASYGGPKAPLPPTIKHTYFPHSTVT